MTWRAACLQVSVLIVCVLSAAAQIESGSIVGTVVDPAGAVVPGVRLELRSESTGVARSAVSNDHGDFEFNAVPAGSYTVTAEHDGFRKVERRNVNLLPNDHLSLGQIRLQVGEVTQEVVVRAEGATVQTASSERSGVITNEQVQNLTVINRDFSVLVALLPGVVLNEGSQSQGFNGSTRFNANGGRSGQNNITIDGIPAENSNGTSMNTFISMDAISVVKVEDSNFQAEFGRKPGASVQAVTKSGGLQYHGSLYWYQRNEAFDARQVFPNPNGEPAYRFITAGANIGGPVYIPKLIPRGQKKLFFFYSQEIQREARPQDPQRVTVPTALERQGDFSQTFSSSGKLVLISDPTQIALGKKCKIPGDPGCFPLNKIPVGRINALGQAYLNLFPLPNIAGSNFNYLFQESFRVPKHTETARIDYVLSPTTNIYAVLSDWAENELGSGVPAGSSKWGWLPANYNPVSKTAIASIAHTFSPTLILEGSVSGTRWTESANPSKQNLDARNRALTGVTIPQFDPQNNPLKLVPQAKFGSTVPNAAEPTYDGRFPITGVESVFTGTSNLTKVWGVHTSKAGIFVEHWQQLKGINGNFAGTLDFSSGSFGGNTGYGYANAILGSLNSYSESDTRPPLIGRYNGIEWYLQDSWKALSRLTLDMGVRFGWSQPFHTNDLHEAGFIPTLWDPAAAVKLVPCTSTSRTCPPGTTPTVQVGSIIAGSGNINDGTVDRVLDPSYPQGLRNNWGPTVAPRLGFAYDPFGKGATAIRSGFGIFYDIRDRDNFYLNLFKNPPLQNNAIVNGTTLSTFTSAAGLLFPSSTSGFDANRKAPYIMAYNLDIQQQLWGKTVLDVAYVGNMGRHLLWRRNINAIPYGTVGPTDKTPSQLFRPFPGYGDINISQYAATSNYNSLQVLLSRRFTRGLLFSGAWTFSKAMDYADDETQFISNLQDPRLFNYGRAGFDHTHIVKGSFTWDVPRASRLWNSGFSRKVLDDWQFSGIYTFLTGSPQAITVDQVIDSSGNRLSGTGISGSPSDAARVVLLRDPNLSSGQRSVAEWFDISAITPPAQGTPGNAPRFAFIGPGENNWDMALGKKVPLTAERVVLQLRAEAYNVFNHPFYASNGVDAKFRWDATRGIQTNPTFGQIITAQANGQRRLQLSLRLSF
jgi:hypothetical protein